MNPGRGCVGCGNGSTTQASLPFAAQRQANSVSDTVLSGRGDPFASGQLGVTRGNGLKAGAQG
jgi:hypothetical protein